MNDEFKTFQDKEEMGMKISKKMKMKERNEERDEK